MKTITFNPNHLTLADCLILTLALALVLVRYTAQILGRVANLGAYLALTLWHSLHTAWVWLRTTHDFSNEEGEIFLKGWQYVGIGCALFVFSVLVSIAG